MKLIVYEFKRHFKVYFFWMLGVAAMSIYGMTEFSGIMQSGESIDALMKAFPKIVLVIFGMSGFDVGTLLGYYGILFIYNMIMIALFAISMGNYSTAYDINEKTADFIYTKPKSRFKIASIKQLVAVIYLFLFSAGSYIFIITGLAVNNLDNDVNKILILLNISLFLIGIFFLGIGALCGSISHRKGALIANVILLLTYITSVIYDLLSSNEYLRYFTPLRYFDGVMVIKDGSLDIVYIIISIVLSIFFLILANYKLEHKNIE